MRLLVSVRSAAEALAALAGGADIIDAKDPDAGALGAVRHDVFRDICATVGRRATVSAALGDAAGVFALRRDANAFVSAGASFVKVGFASIADTRRVEELIAAVGPFPLIAVAYADAGRVGSVDPFGLVEAAARAGARGVLVDTARKDRPGLRDLMPGGSLRAWIATARASGLLAAVAGKLTEDDVCFVRDAGADIAGVRSAACEGGRSGHVSADKVRRLRSRIDGAHHVSRPEEVARALSVSPGNQ
jgi:uncharacterized protein (UPF0264 family)